MNANAVSRRARAGDNRAFTFPTTINRSYTVQFNDGLNTMNWLFRHTVVGNGPLTPCLVLMTNATRCLFRARQL